ncbi:hypothetical protein [Streptomyces atratus]|uniref:hypothetical protein n=1 Tax=Streptomyces atratus TaxID=1893 RepID=UPI0033F47C7A
MKGTLVSAVAAVACYEIWACLRQWAQEVSAADPDTMFAGSFELLLAGFTGVVSMPVLLWARMRALGERRNHLFVTVGAVAWPFLGGHIVEDYVSDAGTAVYLALLTGLCGLSALAAAPKRQQVG